MCTERFDVDMLLGGGLVRGCWNDHSSSLLGDGELDCELWPFVIECGCVEVVRAGVSIDEDVFGRFCVDDYVCGDLGRITCTFQQLPFFKI